MFGRIAKNESPELDEVIAKAYVELKEHSPETPDYKEALTALERLQTLKTANRSKPVSKDTVFIVMGNLLGILVIVAYEQKHVMVSKAMGFVGKAS